MIIIKSKQEIDIMRQGGKILASVLLALEKEVKPGVTTQYLDEFAEKMIYKNGALPAFKGYQGFPNALCASVNEEVVHGLPSERKLAEGDIIGLDLGVIFPPERCSSCSMMGGCGQQRGMYADAAITVAVGRVSPEAEKLIKAAKGALEVAIDLVKPGRKLNDISKAIQKYAEEAGFSVIRDLVGHGVGFDLHEEPTIPNFDFSPKDKIILEEGMTLAFEPMLSAGKPKIKKSSDKFGFRTADKSLSSHFEHTIAVTKDGCEVLTKM